MPKSLASNQPRAAARSIRKPSSKRGDHPEPTAKASKRRESTNPDFISSATRYRPTAAELQAAVHGLLPDIIAPDLHVLFCGINPGLYSTAIGHHFGRPGNRFWPALHASGFTPRLYHPSEDRSLLTLHLGITNLAPRTTATADHLTSSELIAGSSSLRRKLQRFRPRVLAMVGLTAYRTAFAQPRATIGLQPEIIGSTRVWLLPNPSGLNAHHQPADLARLFSDLRIFANAL